MKKKVFALTAAVLLLLTVAANAALYAAAPHPELTFSGTTANCYVEIKSPGDEIEATMELRRGSTVLATWSDSAEDVLVMEETWPVTKGQLYTLRVYGSIGGVDFQDISVSATCR